MKKVTIIEELPCELKNCLRDNCEDCFAEHSKTEQIPENFEELKQLCKEFNNKIKDIQVNCIYEKHILIQWSNDDNTDINIFDDGDIFVENHLFAQKLSPERQWQILKAIIGDY